MSQNALDDCRCASTSCLVDTFTGRVGVVRKMLSLVPTSETCVMNTPGVCL